MSWKSIADLIGSEGQVAILGAPMEAGSVTPGRCDLAPETLRQALRRFSTYDVERGSELFFALRDLGDVPVQRAVARPTASSRSATPPRRPSPEHRLTILIGGNNAVTRPAAHALGVPLAKVGLITLDAHFDLRGTEGGPTNGNPIRCLLEDGMPGSNICQIGLAPFANTARMHNDARAAGIGIYTMADCLERGMHGVLNHALNRFSHLDVLMVDFDIDVDRPRPMPRRPRRPAGRDGRRRCSSPRRAGWPPNRGSSWST